MDIIKEIEKVNELGEIKTLAYRVEIDPDDVNTRWFARVEDVRGKVYEICLSLLNFEKIGDDTQCQKAVLLNHILQKTFGTEWLYRKELQITAPAEISTVFNIARSLKPVETPGCTNEEKARKFDHILPEFIV